MHNDVDAFVTQWLYDIERILQNKLESLKDDLLSDDEHTHKRAARIAKDILDWLYPPSSTPMSDEQREELIRQAKNIPEMKRLLRTTGRRRGRPRNESSQYAIRALTLHRATDKSWREIALEVRGCDDERPNPERACKPCGEATRQSAVRLKTFLEKQGLYPKILGHKVLGQMSPDELKRLWESL